MTEKMLSFFKGFVKTKDKKCIMKFKNVPASELLTYDEVKDLPEYAGVLADNTVLFDFDDPGQAEKAMDIIEEKQLNVAVNQTTRGKHVFAWNNGLVTKCYTNTKIGFGLSCDIKVGSSNSYAILKFNGEERFTEWDTPDEDSYQVIPRWFLPVKTKMDFLDMEAGEGRNSALYSYEMVLQSNGLTPDEARETIKIINGHILKDPLSDDEIESITRDEAFAKPIFFEGKAFQHHIFAQFMKSHYHIKRINGQLHIYDQGIYLSGYKFIESKMVEAIPNLRATQRMEALKFLEISTPQETYPASANYVAFENGIYDLATKKLLPFSPEYVVTNKIPWDYNSNAYSELADKTLDKIACNDKEIRQLLEECIGYCFFRENELSKSFILTGQGSNGKSTFLDMVRIVLGRKNYVSLDLDELSEKFSTSAMFGKLANIGDDISDEFLQGKSISQFKKIVSGNDIKAENKGQDVFFFKPTVKLLFSANEIPRVRNKGLLAIKRRLVIIPFNAKFSKEDPDFDSRIIWKLKTPQVAEYLVQIGLRGLERVLSEQDFTVSQAVKDEIDNFERDNNPILQFIEELDVDEEIYLKETKEVFARYDTFCHENGYNKSAMQTFSKEICKLLDCRIVTRKRTDGSKKNWRLFVKGGE